MLRSPLCRCKVFILRGTWGPEATTEGVTISGCLAGMGACGLELLGSCCSGFVIHGDHGIHQHMGKYWKISTSTVYVCSSDDTYTFTVTTSEESVSTLTYQTEGYPYSSSNRYLVVHQTGAGGRKGCLKQRTWFAPCWLCDLGQGSTTKPLSSSVQWGGNSTCLTGV